MVHGNIEQIGDKYYFQNLGSTIRDLLFSSLLSVWILILIVLLLRHIKGHPRVVKAMILGCLFFWIGVVFINFLPRILPESSSTIVSIALSTLEEWFEMLGAIFIICGINDYRLSFKQKTIEFVEDHRELRNILFGLATLLLGLYLINAMMGQPIDRITALIHLGKESNLPTWYSSLLWAFASYCVFQCSVILKNKDAREARFWLYTSCIFLFLSCDEVAKIHESVGQLLNRNVFHLDINGS